MFQNDRVLSEFNATIFAEGVYESQCLLWGHLFSHQVKQHRGGLALILELGA